MSVTSRPRSRLSEARRLELSNVSSLPASSRHSTIKLHTKITPSSQRSKRTSKKTWTFPQLNSLPAIELSEYGKKYLRALPRLLLGILLYLALMYIFSTMYPDTVANWLLYHSYIIVLFIFYLANFFILSFIFLNKRRGVFFSSLLTFLLFLQLQDFVLPLQFLVGSAIVIALAEFIWGVSNKH